MKHVGKDIVRAELRHARCDRIGQLAGKVGLSDNFEFFLCLRLLLQDRPCYAPPFITCAASMIAVG